VNVIRANAVEVAKIFQARCRIEGCDWRGELLGSYREANDARFEHLDWHRAEPAPDIANGNAARPTGGSASRRDRRPAVWLLTHISAIASPSRSGLASILILHATAVADDPPPAASRAWQPDITSAARTGAGSERRGTSSRTAARGEGTGMGPRSRG